MVSVSYFVLSVSQLVVLIIHKHPFYAYNNPVFYLDDGRIFNFPSAEMARNSSSSPVQPVRFDPLPATLRLERMFILAVLHPQ